jgi:hypothetical protein
MSLKDELLRRAQEYSQRHGLALGDRLGAGVHGTVLATEGQPKLGQAALRSAVKIHEREEFYRRERDVYLRLQEHGVTTARGCEVPQMLRYDDQLWVIEMTMVSRPFVLDFAGAYLDVAPDFSEEVLAEWRADKLEQFESRWPEVQAILHHLEAYGVFMVDVNPGNVSFGD